MSTPQSRPGTVSTRVPIADRLSDEAPLAVGRVLHEAHQHARRTRLVLELEAADPRVAALEARARDLQRDIAGLIVEVAADEVER